MRRVTILDPTAPPPDDHPDPGPDAGPVSGRVVGIRFDRTWRSFRWVMDEWATSFRAAGAEVRTWCAGSRIGEGGERTTAELQAFADAVDLAVLGLGN
jgi:hypothetical protein